MILRETAQISIMMTPKDSALLSEAYEVTVTGKTGTRRFILRTADPEAVRQNFPVPGDDLRVLSITPAVVRENLITIHELVAALAQDCSNPPSYRTLLDWARAGLIPHQRVGKKFLRFVEADVRAAMKQQEKEERS